MKTGQRWIVAALAWIAFAVSPALHAQLPPAECLRLVRAGRAAALAGDSGAAIARLREARERFPGELPPVTALLDLDARFGLPETERASLEATLLQRLRDPEASLPAASLLYLRSWIGDDRERLEALMEALERRLSGSGGEPDPALIEVAAETAARLERWEAARGYLERLLAERPDDLGLLWQCVQLDRALERWESAQKLLDRIARHPQGGGELARAERIGVLLHLGRRDEALAELTRLEQQVSTESGLAVQVQALQHDLAWEMRDAGRDEEARTLWRRVALSGQAAVAGEIGGEAEFRHLAGMRGTALQALVDLYGDPEARARLSADLPTTPGPTGEANPFEDLNRGAQLLAAGESEAAFELLGPVTEEMPDSPEAWFNYALAAFQLERWEEAARAYARVAELDPDLAEAHRQRGLALYNLDRCAETVEALERSLALDPAHWQTHYYLARCYGQLGQPERAQSSWEAYQAAKPAGD
ncbi:MAG: tetratricopeptide repeat protein [Thermoanaerobaculia bacterium]